MKQGGFSLRFSAAARARDVHREVHRGRAGDAVVREDQRALALAEHAAIGVDEARFGALQGDAGELARPGLGRCQWHERRNWIDERQAEIRNPAIPVAGRAGLRVALSAGAQDQAFAQCAPSADEIDLESAVDAADVVDAGFELDPSARFARVAFERVAYIHRAAADREDLLERCFLGRHAELGEALAHRGRR